MSGSHVAALRARAIRDRSPLSVSIELTARCNHRCRHCYIPSPPPPDRLTTGRLLELLEELAAAGALHLALTGGEPLLRPDWSEVAGRARQLGFQVALLTSGSLVTPEVADFVACHHITAEVTLPGVTRTSFELISCTAGSFVQTMRGVELLRARGGSMRLKVPVTRLNPVSFVGVFDFARSIGAPASADVRIVARRNGDLAPVCLRVDEMELLAELARGAHWEPA